MLLIYTQKISPRIVYTFKHVCTNVLGISIKFTNKIEEFIAHEGMKLSYGRQALGNEFFLQQVDLLVEQGFSEVEIKMNTWDEVPCFFPVSDASALPFDIFAASFYLLSRYEEYLPHVKDEEGRFPASESLAFDEKFLHLPVIDIWALKFRGVLKNRFPTIEINTRKYKPKAVIAVEHVFTYKNKGFTRSLVGGFVGLLKLNFGKVFDRLKVVFRLSDDPLDVFEDLIGFIKQHKLRMLFLFQLSDFSIHDRNINHNRIPYRSVIKYVADYANVGLLLGYYAVRDFKTLRKEKLRMEEIVHSPLEYVMNSKYNLTLPECFTHLSELEIQNDFSMGYPSQPGFRAGTCTPFLFYDINMEITTPLILHPYMFNSTILENEDFEVLKGKIGKMIEEVKTVGGEFKAIFKNQDFSTYANKDLYYSFLKQIYEVN